MAVRSAPRRGLVRLVRYFVVRPVRLLPVMLVFASVVGALTLLPTLISLPNVSGALRGVGGGEPSATESYLRANRDYNPELMLGSFSDETRRVYATNGGLEFLQGKMREARDAGVKLEEISYIGGKPMPDGTSLQFYVVGYRQPSRPALEYVTQVFTLDSGGKITKVQ